MTALYVPDDTAAHITSSTPVSNVNSVVCVRVTAASPQRHITTPAQQSGFTISFKNIRVNTRVKTGEEAIMKLLIPAETLTEPVLKRYEYKKTPERPLAANSGRSFSMGGLILLNIPIMPNVIEAMLNRNTISDTGL